MVRTMAKSMMSCARMAVGRKLRDTAVTLVRPPPPTQRSRALSHLREGVGSFVALHSRVDAAGFRRLLASSAQGASQRESTIDVLYDGECPLCMHEVTWLSKRNKVRDSREIEPAGGGSFPTGSRIWAPSCWLHFYVGSTLAML